MKAFYLALAMTAIAMLAFPSRLSAVSANSNPIPVTQPDGTALSVRLCGDEWYHFFESEDGHAIIENEHGWWVYADLDPAGRYIGTSFRVGLNDPGAGVFLGRVGRHLREDQRYRTEVRARAHDRPFTGILDWAKDLARTGQRVTMNVPVILIQYPDYPASESVSSFDDMMNQSDYGGIGSLRDYYSEISYGQLTVNATVVGWYTAPDSCSSYGEGSGGLQSDNRARMLARSAVDRAEAAGSLDWADYDNDGDDTVDVVLVIHQGPGFEDTKNPEYIFSHQWFLSAGVMEGSPGLSVSYDEKVIDCYTMTPEISGIRPGEHVEIGVSCHEFGHALGLPDLYDTDFSSEGIGIWGLMGAGNWGADGQTPERPVHMCAWSKMAMGWIVPTVVTDNMVGVSIPQVETNARIFGLWTNGVQGSEYFLVENRQPTGFDQDLPAGGLAVWHIDENRWIGDNTENADEADKLVDLEEADGLNELDSLASIGDAGDLYPGSTLNRFFNGGTNPNSDDYALAPTLVYVDNISDTAAVMTADLGVGQPGAPDLLVRDCLADVGNEPDVECADNWCASVDIWIDNNSDGTADYPILGQVNRLYVRAWNIGGITSDARVKCWFVNPSLGLKFGMGSPGTPIQDAYTMETEKTIPTMGYLPPSPGGAGYRVYFNWDMPFPQEGIDEYCIGCAIENSLDPQTDPWPPAENNLGEDNYWSLVQKAGTIPGKEARGDSTIFREAVRLYNGFGTGSRTVPETSGSATKAIRAPASPGAGAKTPPTSGSVPLTSRQGGDWIGNATVIWSLPYWDYGNTCPCVNDYDETCPYPGSTSPDVVYGFTPIHNMAITVDLCDSQYDTKLYIYAGAPGNLIACNDDAGCGYSGYQSKLENVPLSAGVTYYIIVDGYGGECGSYAIHVYEYVEPCEWFRVAVEGLDPGWYVSPAQGLDVCLPAGAESTIVFDIIKPYGVHMDATHVRFAMYRDEELVDLLEHDIYIDDLAPETVGAWQVDFYSPHGDDPPKPCPTHALSWLKPTEDIGGYWEKIRFFDVHASSDSSRLVTPDATTLVARTAGDDDPGREGYQYHFYSPDTLVYYFTVIPVDLAGNEGAAAPILRARAPEGGAGVEAPQALGGFGLSVNRPNPFAPGTVIRFEVPQASAVLLRVYDVSGRQVATLARGKYGPGAWDVAWDGVDDAGVPAVSGVYFARIQAGNFTATRKMVLQR